MTETSTQKSTGTCKVKVVVTSDRYGNETHGLELERDLAAGVTDLDVALVGRASTSEDELIYAAQDADALLVSTREAINRRIVEQDRALREGAWVEHGPATRRILRGPIQPLREQTLGIVGFGRIGQAVAARAKPFNLTIAAADPYIDPEVMIAAGVEPATLEELLRRSDIVTLHTPLTPETRGLINATALKLMKRTAVLVNTARGPIIDLPALARALQDETIAGAALDVVDPEPLPADSPFYRMSNVILTPHSAYYSERSVDVVRRETLLEALQVLRGKLPRTVANPAVLDKVTLEP